MRDTDTDMAIFCFIFGVFCVVTLIAWALSPPPPPIEQVREERHERFNEAGRSVNEFLRGVVGKKRD